jgi:hypothetical protein
MTPGELQTGGGFRREIGGDRSQQSHRSEHGFTYTLRRPGRQSVKAK